MRWSQAWMLLALSTLLRGSDPAQRDSRVDNAAALVKA